MTWFRSTWGARTVVSLVLGGLLSVTLASAFRAPRPPSSYDQWVRSQLRGPVDDAVSEALAAAGAARAPTLEGFLTAFVETYEARQPDVPVARVLFAVDLTTDALIGYLASRYLGFVGEAVLPRAQIVATTLLSNPVTERLAGLAVASVHGDAGAGGGLDAAQVAIRVPFVVPVRQRSAARPLGP